MNEILTLPACCLASGGGVRKTISNPKGKECIPRLGLFISQPKPNINAVISLGEPCSRIITLRTWDHLCFATERDGRLFFDHVILHPLLNFGYSPFLVSVSEDDT